MSKHKLSNEQRRFVDDIAALLIPWGMPQTPARLYGYLMLKLAPVSLDQIANDLEIAKSSASVSARALEQYHLARRHRVPGSKRVLYEASDNFAGRLAEHGVLLTRFGQLLRDRNRSVATGQTAQRLRTLSEFYLSLGKAMETSISRHHAKFSRSQKTRKRSTRQ